MSLLLDSNGNWIKGAVALRLDAAAKFPTSITSFPTLADVPAGYEGVISIPAGQLYEGNGKALHRVNTHQSSASIIFFGDSITDNNILAGTNRYSGAGWAWIANAFAKWPFEIKGIYGHPGYSIDQLIAVASELQNVDADYCVVLAGTNYAASSSAMIASAETLWELLESYGFKLIICTLPARTGSGDVGSVNSRLSTVSDYYRQQINNGRYVCDFQRVTTDNVTGNYLTSPNVLRASDNLHPNTYGSYVLGNALSEVLKILPNGIPTNDTITPLSSKSLSPNPMLSGIGGTLGANASGAYVPDGHILKNLSGTCSVVCSTVSSRTVAGGKYSIPQLDMTFTTDSSIISFGWESTTYGWAGPGGTRPMGAIVNQSGVGYKQINPPIGGVSPVTGSTNPNTVSTTIGDVIADGGCKWVVIPALIDNLVLQLSVTLKITAIAGSLIPYLIFYQDSSANNGSGRPLVELNGTWHDEGSQSINMISINNIGTDDPNYWTEVTGDWVTIKSQYIKTNYGAGVQDIFYLRAYLAFKGAAGSTASVEVKNFDLRIIG